MGNNETSIQGVMKAIKLLILLLGLAASQAPSPPEILEHPRNTTAVQDDRAEFVCLIKGVFRGWKINGTNHNSLPDEVRCDTETHHHPAFGFFRLTIVAKPAYDGSQIRCLAGPPPMGGQNDNIIGSHNATLFVYRMCTCDCDQEGEESGETDMEASVLSMQTILLGAIFGALIIFCCSV